MYYVAKISQFNVLIDLYTVLVSVSDKMIINQLKYLKFTHILILLLLFVFTTGCGIYRKTDARKIPVNVHDRVEKNIQEGRGFRVFDKARQRGIDERNAFLAAQEEKRKAEEQRQKDIQEAATKRTYSLQDLQDSSDRGTGQSYAAARARTASRVGPGGNVRAYGLKDGGLATMFRNKR